MSISTKIDSYYLMHEGLKTVHLSFSSKQRAHRLETDSKHMLWVTCLRGSVKFRVETLDVAISLTETETVLLAVPPSMQDLEIRANKGEVVITHVSLKLLHEMLAVNFDLGKMSRSKFDYQAAPGIIHLSPRIVDNIQKWFLKSDTDPFKKIHDYGNFLTSFSTVLGQLFGNKIKSCPVRLNLEAETALREAHRKIISNLTVIPDSNTLALQVKIPENVLAEGFKHVYGKSIYKYYLDYKMEKALVLLESGQLLIKEVAFELGYQNPSHFIAAFKKKFGKTPKQYLLSDN